MTHQTKRILAVVPARGGSKGIQRKNTRMLNGKPLFWHMLEAAKKSKFITDLITSTEDEEIAQFTHRLGLRVVKRPRKFADDNVTLDPVIEHAVTTMEKEKKITYDLVITLQPTSPLITATTIDKAITLFQLKKADTLISVTAQRHLYWKMENGKAMPMYKKRVNRQKLEPIFQEAGAILISRRNLVTAETRISGKITLFEIPDNESLDIDSYDDWHIARHRLTKQRIVIRTAGYPQIGLGHIYRTLTLALHIYTHDIIFMTEAKHALGIKKLSEFHYPIVTFKDDRDFFRKVKRLNPSIVINDILNTSSDYIIKLKEMGKFVVNFEDLGDGSLHADLVFNSIYEFTINAPGHFFGHKYECVRDEFFLYRPEKINKQVNKITITFGGTDQNNLTERTLKALKNIPINNIYINVILGLGFSETYKKTLKKVAETLGKKTKVEIKQNIKNMAQELSNSDIVVTSNGRTIYEVAVLGVPCLAISQNDRESTHLFSHVASGIINLGHANTVSEKNVANQLKKLINNYKLREKMAENLRSYHIENGTENVLKIIFNTYFNWKK